MEEKWSCHSRRLVNPINPLNTQQGQIIEFKKSNEDYTETFDVEHDYNIEELSKFAKLDMLETDELGKFKENMTPVPYGPDKCIDGKLMKRVKEVGFGDSPVLGPTVKLHYMYYAELQEIPIDISYLRRSMPEKFRLGSSTLIPAFEYAVLSMKKGEKSDFFASYQLCFGKLGCPPRIPPKADLLFEVKLIDFTLEVDLKSASADIDGDSLVKNPTDEPAFDSVMRRVEELSALGKNAFNDKNIVGAMRRYKDVLRLLFNLQVNNNEEQMKLEQYLCKTYRNLMICNNHNKKYRVTCDCGNKAVQFASHFASKDMKLFFLWGKALNGLLEWKNAISKLKTALKLATKESERADIQKEILEAETKLKNYNRDMRSKCVNMFGANEKTSEKENRQDTTEDSNEDPQFEKLMCTYLSQFREDETKYSEVMGRADTFLKTEIDTIQQLSTAMGLTCTVGEDIVLTKPH